MRGKAFIGCLCFLLLAGCRREPVVTEEDEVRLCVSVRIPDMVQSKAGEELSPEESEALIQNLYIWVFRSDNGAVLGYIHPGQGQHRLTDFEDRYFITLSAEVARERPRVDVYVLANPEGLGSAQISNFNNSNLSREKLQNLVMTGSSFGIDASGNPTHAAVPDKGLPYSGVGRNLEMGGNYPSMTVPTVTIRRTVSRFRLVLSQLADAVGPVVQFSINELSIDGNLLPLEESVFNDSAQPYKISGGYVSQKTQFPIPSSIASNFHPQNYAGREGQSAQSFEAQILEGVQSGELTQLGPYYFRETDKPLSGRIRYSIMGGAEKENTFAMSSAGFTRNHSWTVYLYFLSTEMDFQVSWTPWEQGQDFYLK